MTYLLATAAELDTAAPLPDNIENITGALFVGIILNWALFGVLLIQVYIYSILYRKTDTVRTRTLVYGLCVLEIAQTTLTTMDGFHWFVYGWGNMKNLKELHMAAINSPIFDAVIGFIAQSYFCWRISILGGDRWRYLAWVLVSIASVQMVAGFVTGVRAIILNNGDAPQIQSTQVIETAIWLSSSALVDVLIAISLTVLLSRSRTSIPSTDDIIGRLIKLVVETNALTAGVAVLTLILFISFPHNNYFLCPPYILSKLYSNTVLAILNNRIHLTNRIRKSFHQSMNPHSGSQERSSHTQQGSGDTDHRMTPLNVMVKVHHDSHSDLDGEPQGLGPTPPSKVNFQGV